MPNGYEAGGRAMTGLAGGEGGVEGLQTFGEVGRSGVRKKWSVLLYNYIYIICVTHFPLSLYAVEVSCC